MSWLSSQIWIELCRSNGVVTDAYLHAIGDSLGRVGHRVEYTYSAEECPGTKSDIYVVAVAPSAAKLLSKGKKNVVFWAQGVWPEESLERHGSSIRFAACSFVEKMALLGAKRVFVVSSAQQRHYEGKYSIDLSKKTFVMPCSNEPFHREAFFTEGKYDRPVFLYAGSLAKYQCIDLMLDAFAQAQQALPEARLLFYTSEQDEAKRLVEKRGLHNVEVSYKTQAELPAAIAAAKYGFVIRDDSVVNRVSTPTKISTYIANGIIPIYSPSLLSFSETAEGLTRVSYERNTFIEKLLSVESRSIDPNEVLSQYEDYYRRELSYESKEQSLDAFLREGL